jgi:uncharacterized protein
MNGDLSAEQIEDVLLAERVGRIGCHAEGRTVIVPVSYVYDGTAVYAHSADGLKVRTMRANPAVCFEVEHILDATSWRTVIAWGTYEELAGEAEAATLRMLSVTEPPPGAVRPIAYRIVLDEKSGRFERR